MAKTAFLFQLVFQFPFNSIWDYDRVIELEDRMDQLSQAKMLGFVDGHDAGAGEMNIFILTNVPQKAFNALHILAIPFSSEFKAAFRHRDEEDYTVLYPAELNEFSVV